MGLNKQKGNMYGFVTHTWNVIKGKCSHDCVYCYMKSFPQGERRFDNNELRTDLGSGNFIFVGSSNDMFAKDISGRQILKILEYCKEYNDNGYLFQTKNPERFLEFIDDFPDNTTLCTTIETDNEECLNNAPKRLMRLMWIQHLSMTYGYSTMITVEPIMDFNEILFPSMLIISDVDQINIGADSKGHNLNEPSPEKLKGLIDALRKPHIHTEIHLKDNLKRLMKEEYECI